jgi:hypothetical protein
MGRALENGIVWLFSMYLRSLMSVGNECDGCGFAKESYWILFLGLYGYYMQFW